MKTLLSRPAVLFLVLVSAFVLFRGTNADIFKKKEKLALAFLAGMLLGQHGRYSGYPVPIPWPMQPSQVLPFPISASANKYGSNGGGHALPPKKVFHKIVKHYHHFGGKRKTYDNTWAFNGWSPKHIGYGGVTTKIVEPDSPISADSLSLAIEKLPSNFFAAISDFDDLTGSSGFDKLSYSPFGRSDFGDKLSLDNWRDLHASGSSPVPSFHSSFDSLDGADFSFADGHGSLGNGPDGFNKDTMAILKEVLANSNGLTKHRSSGYELDFSDLSHPPVFSKSVSTSTSTTVSSSEPAVRVGQTLRVEQQKPS
ncbi:hypothetical protein BIW11_13782 [Tropilaelaps mercedesae]|uniref:Uncharacterized protein n=1 Tax=Tropilaelaps mercedesae TaxID=418985 RepID=A0A1V9X0F6_9ACAR|nr:hypothetical protein BIW11_13782 [Tropilaelaps mercedesae]